MYCTLYVRSTCFCGCCFCCGHAFLPFPKEVRMFPLSLPNAPAPLTESMEADVFPLHQPERSIVIDGAIGELSMFHSTFGYYAHGVDETTALLPDGWKERLVRVETPATGGAVGWCLEPHDLVAGTSYPTAKSDRLPLVVTRWTEVEHQLALLARDLWWLDGADGAAGPAPRALVDQVLGEWDTVLSKLADALHDPAESSLVAAAREAVSLRRRG